jgi:hypothetical protein
VGGGPGIGGPQVRRYVTVETKQSDDVHLHQSPKPTATRDDEVMRRWQTLGLWYLEGHDVWRGLGVRLVCLDLSLVGRQAPWWRGTTEVSQLTLVH